MGAFQTWCEGWTDIGETFANGWQHLSSGDVTGGILTLGNATLAGIGNTVTLGGAGTAGEYLDDYINAAEESGEDIGAAAIVKHTAGVMGEVELDLQERDEYSKRGWQKAGEVFSESFDHFANGNIGKGTHMFLFGVEDGVGNLVSSVAAPGMTEKYGEYLADKLDANVESVMQSDGTWSADDVKKLRGDNLLETYLLRQAINQGESELLAQDLEQNGQLGWANTLGAIDTGVLVLDVVGGASFAHSATSAVSSVAGKAAASWAAKKAAAEAGEEVAKKSLREMAATAAAKVTTLATKESLAKAGRTALRVASKPVMYMNATQINSYDVNDAVQRVHGYEANGDSTVTAVIKGVGGKVAEQVPIVAEDAGQSVQDAVATPFVKWMKQHPLVAKTTNTIRAGGYATVETLENTTAVAYLSSAIKKFTDYDNKYADQSVSVIAKSLQAQANTEDDTWSERYVNRVKELDAELGVDSSTRLIFGDRLDGSAVSV